MKKCPRDGCEAQIDDEFMCCRACWRRVPAWTKRWLREAARMFEKDDRLENACYLLSMLAQAAMEVNGERHEGYSVGL